MTGQPVENDGREPPRPDEPEQARRDQRFRQQALDSHSISRALGPAVESPSTIPFGHVRLRGQFVANLRRSRLQRRRVPVRVQMQASDCGPTCLAMLLAYHGTDVDLPTLRKETNAGRDGVSARVLLDTARRYGLTGRGVRTTVGGLRGLPAGSILFWNFGHFVVLERATREFVDVVDPAHGRRRIAISQVAESFTGVALEFQPPLPGAGRPVRREKADNPWRLLRLFFPTTRAWLPLTATSLVLLAANLVVPLATAYFADSVLQGRSTVSSSFFLLAILGLLAAFFLLQTTRSLAILMLQTVTDKRVTLGVLHHLLALPYEFFLGHSPGDLAMRVRTSTQLRQVLTSATMSSMFDGILILVYMALLLIADTVLALVVISLAVLQVAVMVLAWRRQGSLAADALEAQSRAQSELVELLDGLGTLKATGLDAAAAERWSHSLVEEINSRVRSKRNLSLWTGGSLSVQFGAPLVVLLVGWLRIANGALSLAEVLGFSALAMGLFVPLANLVQSGLQLSELGATLSRMGDILNTRPENDRANLVEVREVRGGMDLRDVGFSYPGGSSPVLSDVNLRVRPGEFVAVLGPSGCGKSTLAMLVAGLYLPSSGQVLVDGVATDEVDRSSLRASISFVNQDTRLFAGSIRDNIAWGTDGLTDEEVKVASKLAGIHYTIINMPMGYDTLLGPGGTGLSGGQRQRVALTRALVRKPKLLVLDEATSALDPQMEERIFTGLLGLGCTLVVIAHRLTKLEAADQILVLSNGRIVQQGTHSALRDQPGPYSSLVGHPRDKTEDAR
ncbi:peptidase domain-containing ABC transporter [Actinocrispum wychmicini]|uniref:ABC-type bacteriocin/lantibiotic exporter with double-glycine peptidase domain n=1 Tax=Actinocrispum wychmicini TaxID=1213861 RepID=A0A4R2K6E1_9PSEU|nr:peptidase domain-containing ABC transporter [Actinocrispum wychmicini]TCO61905.1 ABC-type bacteriocin/lantibiotic exporter with double-glycine peptidase domain [Actinocrispum wychmicini]